MQGCTNGPNIWGHLKSLGTRRVTCSKSRTEGPHTLDATVTNLVVRATWRPWLLHPCLHAVYIINVFKTELSRYSVLDGVRWREPTVVVTRLFCIGRSESCKGRSLQSCCLLDMIWYMIWYDMIWYDMIWYDMIWWYDMQFRYRAGVAQRVPGS